MKSLITLIVALSSTAAFAESVCHDTHRLFDNGPVYQCETDMEEAESGVLCIETGYHDAVKMDGFLLRTPENPDSALRMFFHDPHWAGCWLSNPLKGCKHRVARFNAEEIYGYRYRGPDFWDARSSESEFNYDFESKEGSLEVKWWGVNKKIKGETNWSVTNCQEIE